MIASTRDHGRAEPVAYLHAIKREVMSGSLLFINNPREKPTAAQVAEQMRLRGRAFEDTASVYM